MPSVPSVEKLCAHVASLKSSSEIARPLLTRGAEGLYIYRICPNRSLGFYFVQEIFDPASILARLLLNLPDFVSET